MDMFLLFISVLIGFIFFILSIILFFKIWGMTNDVAEIRKMMEADRKMRAKVEATPVSEETKIEVQSATAEEQTVIGTPQPKTDISTLAGPRVEPNRSDKKKSKWWLWSLIVVIVAIGGYFALNWFEERRIEEMVAQDLGRDSVYEVGDYYNRDGKEGIVFEVSDGGRHGKILSLDEAYLQWCTNKQYYREIVVKASSEVDGKYNTDKVMRRSDSNEYSAFVWCRDKGKDWYLPSKKELETIYKNRSKINQTLRAKNEEGLGTGYYWSSTELSEVGAWDVPEIYGNLEYYKYDYTYVRAVSAF